MPVIYPFSYPIILTDEIFTAYGGQTGTFSHASLQNSYWLAEMQVTSYIGTPLLPVTITGTYPFMNKWRLATDYGYVQEIKSLNILTRETVTSCDLTSREGCAYIYEDTYGYVDFRQLDFSCNCGWSWWGGPYPAYAAYSKPYQIQIAYTAGLPTGTANQPGILEALTIVAQIDLNEKSPGLVGANEGVGDIAIQKYSSLDYTEERGRHSLVKTALGESAKSMRAKRLIDASIRRARKVLFA